MILSFSSVLGFLSFVIESRFSGWRWFLFSFDTSSRRTDGVFVFFGFFNRIIQLWSLGIVSCNLSVPLGQHFWYGNGIVCPFFSLTWKDLLFLIVPFGGRLCLGRGTWNTEYLQTRQLMVRLFIQCNILNFSGKKCRLLSRYVAKNCRWFPKFWERCSRLNYPLYVLSLNYIMCRQNKLSSNNWYGMAFHPWACRFEFPSHSCLYSKKKKKEKRNSCAHGLGEKRLALWCCAAYFFWITNYLVCNLLLFIYFDVGEGSVQCSPLKAFYCYILWYEYFTLVLDEKYHLLSFSCHGGIYNIDWKLDGNHATKIVFLNSDTSFIMCIIYCC